MRSENSVMPMILSKCHKIMRKILNDCEDIFQIKNLLRQQSGILGNGRKFDPVNENEN